MARKPEPTRKQVQRFIKKPQIRVRMDLVLDFDRLVSLAEGHEAARKFVDALQCRSDAAMPDGFAGASLKCAELRRIVKIDS